VRGLINRVESRTTVKRAHQSCVTFGKRAQAVYCGSLQNGAVAVPNPPEHRLLLQVPSCADLLNPRSILASAIRAEMGLKRCPRPIEQRLGLWGRWVGRTAGGRPSVRESGGQAA
jgi:hypothetical protein